MTITIKTERGYETIGNVTAAFHDEETGVWLFGFSDKTERKIKCTISEFYPD